MGSSPTGLVPNEKGNQLERTDRQEGRQSCRQEQKKQLGLSISDHLPDKRQTGGQPAHTHTHIHTQQVNLSQQTKHSETDGRTIVSASPKGWPAGMPCHLSTLLTLPTNDVCIGYWIYNQQQQQPACPVLFESPLLPFHSIFSVFFSFPLTVTELLLRNKKRAAERRKARIIRT